MSDALNCLVCGYIAANVDELVYNRANNTMQCQRCGTTIQDLRKLEEAALLKLAEHNRVTVRAFEIVTSPAEWNEDQYMVMWGMEEGELFRPEYIRGVWGAKAMADVTIYYRETGVLRLPKHPTWEGMHYEYVQPNWVYFMKTETMMHRMGGYNEVQLPKEQVSVE